MGPRIRVELIRKGLNLGASDQVIKGFSFSLNRLLAGKSIHLYSKFELLKIVRWFATALQSKSQNEEAASSEKPFDGFNKIRPGSASSSCQPANLLPIVSQFRF